MKRFLVAIAFLIFSSSSLLAQSGQGGTVKVSMDLNNVKDDKVMVSVAPPKITEDKITYSIPKIIPGTYSADDYGKYIDNFSAIDKKGKALTVTKKDENSWEISGAKNLATVSYWVNDTYDIETSHDIFSPAGTNIAAGQNFMLNMHGFVGYFTNKNHVPYEVIITHPATLWGATSLVDADASTTRDVFTVSRYAELVDNPMMYSKPDYTTFTVDDMEILISVYSPTGKVDAQSLRPDMEKMMRAQKKFLGPINTTKKYSVLLYLSDMQIPDAKGFGALEHNTSTTVVFPEMMPKSQLMSAMIDVVAHEFFHIVTPLSIHSEEIHSFDFNNPKMSQHLWMYEGVTEYFANLFQVQQGLIDESEFYTRMEGKINGAARMNDNMSFTEMSKNVLVEPYKGQYLNVYEKGTLIGMCIDIIIREKSNGQRGILDLMQKLAVEYGPTKPFKDEELFAKITQLTYPEVGAFLNTHVKGTTPINYNEYFARVGVTKGTKRVPGNVFLKGQSPFITIKSGTKDIMVMTGTELNSFMTTLGIKGGDIIKEINGTAYNLDNIYEMIMSSQEWKENNDVTVKVMRDGKEQILKGKVKISYEDQEGLLGTDASKDLLRNAWLRG
ncbi:MAG TPA: peptidase M61 [Flavobacterium sp.]|nr:peptidase M61 [Flavobacterium sp.]